MVLKGKKILSRDLVRYEFHLVEVDSGEKEEAAYLEVSSEM